MHASERRAQQEYLQHQESGAGGDDTAHQRSHARLNGESPRGRQQPPGAESPPQKSPRGSRFKYSIPSLFASKTL